MRRALTSTVLAFAVVCFWLGVAAGSEPARRPAGTTDWRTDIDSIWGPGLPTATKLTIFEWVWGTIDQSFSCFHDLEVNWDSLHAVYQPEIAQGVSRGRFAAIMGHLTLALKTTNTYVVDRGVSNSALEPGVPLVAVGGWGAMDHFGAGLTPLPDRSLLVYKTVSPHPLGLEPGDIVLGYDGRPWADIYPELIAAQLPLASTFWGCSPSAYEASWLTGAGMNWHLFDTIDIVKHATGETVHLSTAPLSQLSTPIFCSDQLPVPGVAMPDMENGHWVSWGTIDGTTIGYIYVWAWRDAAEQEFSSAVEALRHSTTGLIVDFRLNFGGNMFMSTAGLSLLFPATTSTIGFAERCNPTNPLALCAFPGGDPSFYVIPGIPANFYNKPIAVLTGPGCRLSGDQVALRMKLHPRARLFGRPTAAAFTSPNVIDLGLGPDWSFLYGFSDAYRVSAPSTYLTHLEFEPDEEVWLQPDDVAQGHDTVVEAAVDWIVRQVPVLVQDLRAESIGDAVHLTWNLAGDEPLRELRVYRQETDADSPTRLASLEPQARDYLDASTQAGMQYEYTLAVVGADGSEVRSQSIAMHTPHLALALGASHPNPFSTSTTIAYVVPAAGPVALRVHDVRGRLVRTLVGARQTAGRHAIQWDGSDESGRTAATGVYVVRLETEAGVRIHKMLLLRR